MFAHLLMFASTTSAATLTVGVGKDYMNISGAARNAVDGDLILVDPGTYDERVLVYEDIEIRAVGTPEETIIADGAELSVLKTWGNLVLDGFTVTTTLPDVRRHCIRVAEFASIVLKNSIITGCTAGDGLGGGLRLDTDSWGVVLDTTFIDNSAVDNRGSRAAHLYSRADSLVVKRCSFIDGLAHNDFVGDGGALFVNSGTLTIEDSYFAGNIAGDDGGVIGLEGEGQVNDDGTVSDGVSHAVLSNNVFEDNMAEERGGVVFSRDVERLDIVGNTFCMNSAGDKGGALYLQRNGGTVSNNVFVDHAAGVDGGTIYLNQDSPILRNNHVIGSEAGDDGGAIYARAVPEFVLHNDLIAWTRNGEAVFSNNNSIPITSHNAFFGNTDGDLVGLSAGAGDVTDDPDLVAWVDNFVCGDDDLRPNLESPLVDAGVPAWMDVDGSTSDIGAYGGKDADPCVGLPEPLPDVCLELP